MIEHIAEPENCMKEIRRVLMPGGRLIISVPNRAVFPIVDNPWHFFHFDVGEFISFLGNFFSSIETYGQHLKQPETGGFDDTYVKTIDDWIINQVDIEKSLCLLAVCS